MYKVMIVDDQKSSQMLMKYGVMLGKDRYTLAESLWDADLVMDSLKYEKPDLILLDIYTGGKEKGIVVAEKVKKLYPEIKIIILTYLLQKRHIEKAREVGCEGFWYKDHADIDLLKVMDSVMEGNIYYPNSQPTVTIGTAKITDFTTKELQILQSKINGMSSEEICMALNIKLRTLNTHISNIKNKTGYTSLIKLVADISAKKFLITEENQVGV